MASFSLLRRGFRPDDEFGAAAPLAPGRPLVWRMRRPSRRGRFLPLSSQPIGVQMEARAARSVAPSIANWTIPGRGSGARMCVTVAIAAMAPCRTARARGIGPCVRPGGPYRRGPRSGTWSASGYPVASASASPSTSGLRMSRYSAGLVCGVRAARDGASGTRPPVCERFRSPWSAGCGCFVSRRGRTVYSPAKIAGERADLAALNGAK
jgi:hypothetical protein